MNKQIVIGVTGHRDMIETEELEITVNDFFKKEIEQQLDKEILLLSPLADGADRFVAKIFLKLQKEHQQLRLIVPMPFTQARYMEDFDEDSKKEFLELLALADGNFRVPTYGDKPPYLGLGIYVSAIADSYLAFWDGIDNGKAGGTAHIVEYAKNMRYNVIHFPCGRRSA